MPLPRSAFEPCSGDVTNISVRDTLFSARRRGRMSLFAPLNLAPAAPNPGVPIVEEDESVWAAVPVRPRIPPAIVSATTSPRSASPQLLMTERPAVTETERRTEDVLRRAALEARPLGVAGQPRRGRRRGRQWRPLDESSDEDSSDDEG